MSSPRPPLRLVGPPDRDAADDAGVERDDEAVTRPAVADIMVAFPPAGRGVVDLHQRRLRGDA
jgi:hypothetical protein